MNAIILSIGDELVLGQTIDTNSAWLSQQLAAAGIAVIAHVTVADDQPAIERAIGRAALECDLLLITGGLGPTPDDLTRQALAQVMGAAVEEDAVWMKELHRFFEARGRAMPPINRIQAMIPRGARMLFNTAGTAAGIGATLHPRNLIYADGADAVRAGELPAARKCEVFVMPGVPREMKAMFIRDVLPHAMQAAGGAAILSRTLHTFGLGESAVAEKLGDLMARDRNPSVGTTVSGGVVSLRINSRYPSEAQASKELQLTESACRAALGDLIYGADEETLPIAVARLLNADSIAARFSPAVATAESCTGGLVAKLLTDVAGSSRYYRQGWITYQNEAKTNELSVPPELIAAHGAVSEPVVRAMAQGAQSRSGAPYALAVSGIAGPTGGSAEKPVGTVWLALAHPAGIDARLFLFPGDREMIRDRAAKMALTLLRFKLLAKPLPF
ncbi:MAG TPA: nicotinamide-nucleotide amidohydrolase family protein [Tepidisphaeraceae bacterium]|nr:nicotinamide-nucleotide amidohydrolase family protein [Tepidisphaeraceae bacterium]